MTTSTPAEDETADPYLWLEEVTGEDALAWVAERNAEAEAAVATGERFARTEARVLEVLDSDARDPAAGQGG